MSRPLRFLLGHEERSLVGISPTLSVLDYLRSLPGRRGTKEGCNEGDCGACTVVLGDPAPDGGMTYRAINACVMFMGMVDGRQLITVEDLAEDGLHPVQQAMVDHEGSQCGFCTPGFVMSLFAYDKSGGGAELGPINDCLAGNLCRCTGYGPIIAAAQNLNGDEDQFTEQAQATAARLRDWQARPMLTLTHHGDDGEMGSFHAPTSIAELVEALDEHPDARIVAGATDIALWVTKALQQLDTLVYVGRVAELLEINESDDELRLGAAVTYTDAHDALIGVFPDLKELLRRLGSEQIRNSGTVGGNLANGSPIGDMPPAMLVLGASLVLRRGAATREVALTEFFHGPGKTDLQPGEFVETVVVPKPGPQTKLRTYKLSKRFDQDISAVCGAFAITVGGDNVVTEARIAYGGMAATPKRAPAAEAALVGQAWTDAGVAAAMAALAQDFRPIQDVRATPAYRSQTAANMLLRAYLEMSGSGVATRLVGDKALANV